MPSVVQLISVSHCRKRRKRMPPPSDRSGLKLWLPLVTLLSPVRSAQPVKVPKSSARIASVRSVMTLLVYRMDDAARDADRAEWQVGGQPSSRRTALVLGFGTPPSR